MQENGIAFSHRIRFVTEKLHGSCRFSVENDLFVLQIIL